jgi:hypothetical protein
MSYLELAIKILEEEQQLLRVEDIYDIAILKGYLKLSDFDVNDENDVLNLIEDDLIDSISEDNNLRMLKDLYFFYLTSFENLPHLVENLLDGPSVNSYKEIVESGSEKIFQPSKRGFDGMILFYAIACGLPVGIYIISRVMDSYFPLLLFMSGIFAVVMCFVIFVLIYLQLTNCSLVIRPETIEFRRIFHPKFLICKIAIKDILQIEAKGLGKEEQISSDFKYLKIKFRDNGNERIKKFRCHAYTNPDEYYNPYHYLIRNHESFVTIRAFLKEISNCNDIEYIES